jgi:hypothetical protein
MIFSIGLFLALSALSAYFTVKAVGRQGVGEINPVMRLLLRSRTLFWVAQGVLAAAVCFFMVKIGPWFVSLAICLRSIVTHNDWLVYKGKIK